MGARVRGSVTSRPSSSQASSPPRPPRTCIRSVRRPASPSLSQWAHWLSQPISPHLLPGVCTEEEACSRSARLEPAYITLTAGGDPSEWVESESEAAEEPAAGSRAERKIVTEADERITPFPSQ